MLDHVGLTVSSYPASMAFYQPALAALGIERLMEISAETTGSGRAAGFGTQGKPFFWLSDGASEGARSHVAFVTQRRADVDAFHSAALAAGGRDNGAPGLRPHYHPDYYGAFVLDPDGNNIEAVCHLPESAA